MPPSSSERRAEPRVEVAWAADLVVTAGSYDVTTDRVGCTVRNISAGGARVELNIVPQWLRARLLAVPTGLPVALIIPEYGAIKGKIAWHRTNAIGIKHDSPFHVAHRMTAAGGEADRHLA